ncbi:MAG: acetyl-CoA carboxylase biotin carboxyl carrier protein [Ruminococcus sp.]
MYSLDELKKLIKILEESQLTSIKISDKKNSVSIEKAPASAPAVTYTATAPIAELPSQAAPVSAPEPSVPSAPITSGKTIDSPMVGVFYSAPNPDSAPFVSLGQEVKKGDVVCIIEAMKIMNEITAEENGKITEILVNNGDVVEYGQPMFRIG